MQYSGHGPNTASLLTHAGNGHPVLRLELLILCSFFHLCTLRYEVLHFRFEAARHTATTNSTHSPQPTENLAGFVQRPTMLPNNSPKQNVRNLRPSVGWRRFAPRCVVARGRLRMLPILLMGRSGCFPRNRLAVPQPHSQSAAGCQYRSPHTTTSRDQIIEWMTKLHASYPWPA